MLIAESVSRRPTVAPNANLRDQFSDWSWLVSSHGCVQFYTIRKPHYDHPKHDHCSDNSDDDLKYADCLAPRTVRAQCHSNRPVTRVLFLQAPNEIGLVHWGRPVQIPSGKGHRQRRISWTPIVQ